MASFVRKKVEGEPALGRLLGLRVQPEPHLEIDTAPDLLRAEADPCWDEVSRPSAAVTARYLERLRPGDRLWWWWGEPTMPSAARLLLQPIHTDPTGERHQHRVALAGGAGRGGVARVTASGRLQLQDAAGHGDDLAALAAWTAANVAAHPALAVLCGAEWVEVDRRGVVLAVHRRPELWQGLAPPPMSGTPERSAEVLAALSGEGWFCLGAQPWLAILPPADTDALTEAEEERRLERFLSALGQRSSTEGSILGRVRRRPEDGGLELLTAASVSLEVWLAQVERLRQLQTCFSGLAGARLVLLRAGQPAAAHTLGADPWLERLAQLEQVSEGERLYAWFSPTALAGQPLLLWAASKEELKSLHRSLRDSLDRDAPHVLATIGGTPLRLTFREELPGIHAAVVSWLRALARQHPQRQVLQDLANTILSAEISP